MNPTTAQQIALDNALVALGDRVKIGKVDVEVFRDILQICPRLPNQEFVVPPSSDLEIVSFIKEIRYTGDIESVTKGIFHNNNVDYVELLWEDFMFQIDNRNTSAARKENMPYPRFTKAIIQHFISKDKSISMRNRQSMHTVQDDSILGSLKFVSKTEEYQMYGALIPAGMTNRKMRDSTAYKTYLAFAIGAVTPKKARQYKKPASLSKKKTLIIVEEPIKKTAKKPTARRQSAGVQIRDTPAALLEDAQLKKAIKRSKRETNIHQAGGSGDGVGLELKVPDEPKGKSINTSEGTGLKPRVPDVSKAYSSKNDEEYDHINKEMYDDVNVNLKDVEPVDEGKGNKEMNDAEKVNVKHEEVNQEDASAQEVKELKNVDHSSTLLATIKSEVSTAVKEYLRISLDDALQKKSVEDIRKVKMEHAAKQQESQNPKHRALYHPLIESILEDEDAMDKGLKRKKKSKDAEPSKKAKSTDTSKGTTKSQPKSTGKSAQPEETVFEAGGPIVPADYFFNNDLAYLQGGSTDRTYTTSLTMTKAAKYDLKGIEDMNRLFNLKGEDIVHLATVLHMFTRHVVIQKRVEDLQLGVKSYQKNINISKPRTCDEDLSRRAPYTTLSDPQGVIYEDKLNRKRLMRSDELHKFSDDTLQSVRDTLHDMEPNLRMGYNKAMPKKKWSNLDMTRSHIMVKDIDQQLLERRLMRSLEKFIGGREYGEDLRLLQQKI
ncbi:hypothetical protein Tco_0018454 [Tanacetum coccineum]